MTNSVEKSYVTGLGGATSPLPSGNIIMPTCPGNGDVAPPVRRKYPSHNSVLMRHDNRTVILFVTVCVVGKGQRGRCPSLDNDLAHKCIVDAWYKADAWFVGRYVVMPDHVHFFCAPAAYPPFPFQRWMGYWKRLVAQTFTGGATSSSPQINAGVFTVRGNGDVAPPIAHNTIFQRDQWDTQLRTGESYASKWEYVRNNPVRKCLVARADDWLYQGELNILQWHDR